jgi:hypothetical protein
MRFWEVSRQKTQTEIFEFFIEKRILEWFLPVVRDCDCDCDCCLVAGRSIHSLPLHPSH